MKNSKFLILLLISNLFFLASCSSDDDKEPTLPGDVKDFKFLKATSYTDWTYFSFEKGDTVKVSDPENDLTWDIAFHRYDVKLNGGKSGKGSAEAVNTGETDWTNVTEAPASGYKKDEIGKINISWMEQVDQSFSQELATWVKVDTSNPPPKYTYYKWVYILKAANGKYVKLYLYDYLDAKAATGGYISFKYQYNESGSNQFI